MIRPAVRGSVVDEIGVESSIPMEICAAVFDY